MDAPYPPGENPGRQEQEVSRDRRARMDLILSANEVLEILVKVEKEARSNDRWSAAKRGSNIPQG